MTYKFEVTQELLDVSVEAAMRLPVGKKQLKKYYLRCIFGAVLMALLALIVDHLVLRIAALSGAAFLVLFTIFFAKKVFRNHLRKTQGSLDPTQISGTREYTFSEEKVALDSDGRKSEFGWDYFSFYTEIDHYYFLSLKDGRSLVVDKERLSEDERSELDGYIVGKLRRIVV